MTNMILDAFYSLGKSINKARGTDATDTDQGIVGPKFPELTLDMKNEDLAALTRKWDKKWTESSVYTDWVSKADENENYWLGKQYDKPAVDKTRPMVDNAIFEALETYLPTVTRQDPEAMVALVDKELEKDKAAMQFVTDLTKDLGVWADDVRLRLKLKKGARHWAIYLLGAAKLGWDLDNDRPALKIVRARKLILDPDATIDEDGYSGDYVGEHRKLAASAMISMLEASDAEAGAVKAIKDLVGDDLGTEVGFIEWWTDQYMCWTLDKEVLLKKKNMHWNYDKEVPVAPEPQPEEMAPQMPTQIPGAPTVPQLPPQPAPTEPAPAPEQATAGPTEPNATEVPQEGEEAPPEGTATQEEPQKPPTQTVKGINHLKVPKIPYKFLSVFNLGKQPVDDTSLITQNLSSQDRLNKRNKQIDKNADSMNGGMVVSGERSGLTQQQSKGVTEALRKGGTVYIPAGAVGDAIARMSAPGLPADVFNDRNDTRNRIADIFGTRGINPAGLNTEKTVGGKQMNAATDQSRIGGGFSEYLEQFAEEIYDYATQLLYVYSDKYANGTPKPPVTLSVKQGSLLPKDATALAAQAVELAKEGKMALIDLYTALDYANPKELAANVWLEANAPELLFQDDPRVGQAIQMKQQAAQAAAQVAGGGAKPPSESINFKDLPPDGRVQMAAKVGITLHPEAVAAHDEVVAERGKSKPPAEAPAPKAQ